MCRRRLWRVHFQLPLCEKQELLREVLRVRPQVLQQVSLCRRPMHFAECVWPQALLFKGQLPLLLCAVHSCCALSVYDAAQGTDQLSLQLRTAASSHTPSGCALPVLQALQQALARIASSCTGGKPLHGQQPHAWAASSCLQGLAQYSVLRSSSSRLPLCGGRAALANNRSLLAAFAKLQAVSLEQGPAYSVQAREHIVQ